MYRTISRDRLIGLALTTALATISLAGCTTKGAPRADLSASRAEVALAKGNTEQAVNHAEAAVMTDPRNAAYRAMLGNIYLGSGRFNSAIASYNDAMSLGDATPRTALSLALANIAAGNQGRAVSVLDDWRDAIAPSDLGLAYALAGEADRGVLVLADALRGGENTAKVRQNLAYAYALAGQWREARLMAAQDVPGDQIDQRISDWAHSAHPEAFRQRVATLLSAPANVTDPGQPTALALANTPGAEQLAAEASAMVHDDSELPALETSASTEFGQRETKPEFALARYEAPMTSPPQSFEAAFATKAPGGATPGAVMADAIRFVASPVVQKMPARFGVAPDPQARMLRGIDDGSHLVQLGSFYSEQAARRAWGLYTRRHPALDGHELKLTQAKVNGHNYWRVLAVGFDQTSARDLCASVKSTSKEGCIAYSAARPLPGAIS